MVTYQCQARQEPPWQRTNVHEVIPAGHVRDCWGAEQVPDDVGKQKKRGVIDMTGLETYDRWCQGIKTGAYFGKPTRDISGDICREIVNIIIMGI